MNYYKKKMPEWAAAQLNGKTAEENYYRQKRKFQKRELIRNALEEIQKEYDNALYFAIQEEEERISEMAANNFISQITAAFDGGTINPNALKNKSFAAELGAAFGRAIGQAPFKLLEEILEED